MEYVPARSLAQIVAVRGPLTPEQAGAIRSRIADALAKSHEEGAVHGDVTPENILVTDEGVARLTDFGISRALWSEVTWDDESRVPEGLRRQHLRRTHPAPSCTNAVGDHTVELFKLTVCEQQRSTKRVCDTAKGPSATVVKNSEGAAGETRRRMPPPDVDSLNMPITRSEVRQFPSRALRISRTCGCPFDRSMARLSA
ncbi:protein kinase domain-containing protein [Streptomyces sp. KM273126]|uniref:protein kinase domain-containing protein n=1 Tax=Streptomyces sp. KM273126 TaxID=2545247 RepID=UPI0026C5DCFA